MSDNSEKTIKCQGSSASKFSMFLVICSLLIVAVFAAREKGRKVLEKAEEGRFEGGIPSEEFDNATHTFIGARNLKENPHEGQYLLWDSDGNPDTIEAVTRVQGAEGSKLPLSDLVALWEVKQGDKLTGKQINNLCPDADTTTFVKGPATNTGASFFVVKKGPRTP